MSEAHAPAQLGPPYEDRVIVSAAKDAHLDETQPPALGNMGLRGIWAQLANASALMVLAVVLFLTMHQVNQMHTEGISALKQMHTEGIGTMRQLMDTTLSNQQRVIADNTTAIKDLANEVRAMRQFRQQHSEE